MDKGSFPLVSYAVQSKGPVLSGLMIDNGIALLAGYLLEAGYSPRIFDYNNAKSIEKIAKYAKECFVKEKIDELDDFIKRNDSRIIGFKLYANGFRDSVRIAEDLKKRNSKVIFAAGGPHAGIYSKKIMEYTDVFDVIVQGEGDRAVVRLADFAYKGRSISGAGNLIIGNKVSRRYFHPLRKLVYPVYDSEIYADIEHKIFLPVIEDSRGCPYAKCSFCLHPKISGRNRIRDIETVIDEIENNHRLYGAEVSRLSGSTPSLEMLGLLSKSLGSLTPDYKLSSFAHARRDYDYSCLKDVFIGLFFGLESADNFILENVLNKTKDSEEYLESYRFVVSQVKESDIASVLSMIVPSPFDTVVSMRKSLDYVLGISPDFVNVLPMGVLPGSVMARKAEKNPEKSGVLLDDDYRRKYMLYELDLLKSHEEWPDMPLELNVDGEFRRDIFGICAEFMRKLGKGGLASCSDEIVLMAYLYNKGFSDRKDRWDKSIRLKENGKRMLKGGDYKQVYEMLKKIKGSD